MYDRAYKEQVVIASCYRFLRRWDEAMSAYYDIVESQKKGSSKVNNEIALNLSTTLMRAIMPGIGQKLKMHTGRFLSSESMHMGSNTKRASRRWNGLLRILKSQTIR